MTNNLILPPRNQLIRPLDELHEKAKYFANASRSAATNRAYRIAWNDFQAWCDQRQFRAMPAMKETIALYLTDRAATLKVATLQLRYTAISLAHQKIGYPIDTKAILKSPHFKTEDDQLMSLSEVWKGIKKKMGVRQNRKEAISQVDIRLMIRAWGDDLRGVRNKAIILLGFAGAFRRSEIVNLLLEDFKVSDQGARVLLRRSKTDQEGEGYEKGIMRGRPGTCPVAAVQEWIERSGITDGVLFRSVDRHGRIGTTPIMPRIIADVVKEAAAHAGLKVEDFAGHSLRSGHATSAKAAGADITSIMKQGGWKSTEMVNRYIRLDVFTGNSSAGLL